MAALGNNVKMAFLKGLEALGKGASNMATNAHQKLNEINLETRRRELLSEIPVRALDLWQQGEPMPQPLGDMLSELSALDEQLTVLRAQRYARVETEAEEGAAAAPESESVPEDEDTRRTPFRKRTARAGRERWTRRSTRLRARARPGRTRTNPARTCGP